MRIPRSQRCIPITSRPTLVFDDQANLRIYFGTGKYLIGSDKEDTTWNAYYCIIEKKFVKTQPNDENDGHYTIAPATPLGPSDLANMTSYRTEGELSNYLSGLSEAEQAAVDTGLDETLGLDRVQGLPGDGNAGGEQAGGREAHHDPLQSAFHVLPSFVSVTSQTDRIAIPHGNELRPSTRAGNKPD